MLTYEDCVGMCELTAEEIRAISEHEHIPEIVAAELGAYLVKTPEGESRTWGTTRARYIAQPKRSMNPL